MQETKRFLYVGFMCHQAVEKILKAYLAKQYNEHPPRTHNLRMLARQADIFHELDDDQKALINILEPLNIEARYPTDKKRLLKSLDSEKCEKIILSTKEMITWIKAKL
jgi:HEPN domain-containing protein